MNYDVNTLKNMDKNELINKFLSIQSLLNSKIKNQEETITAQIKTITEQTEKLSNKESQIRHLLDVIAWFQRHLFGKKSEKVLADNSGMKQLPLFDNTEYKPEETPPEPTVTVKSYEKRSRKKGTEFTDCDGRLKYDDTVPVEEIVIMPKEVDGLTKEEYEVIGTEKSEYLMQRPSSHYVKRIIRKTVKLKNPAENQKQIITGPLPSSVTVIEKSIADVTFLAGLVINKFRYHMPLNRQYQQIIDSHISISRGTLTNLVNKVAELLEPVYEALRSKILQCSVVNMDETPVKADRENHKMKSGYFWVIHGDGETAFLYSPSRSGENVKKILKEYCGVIVSDGYQPYETFALNNQNVLRAQCWAHVRRKFFEALDTEPNLATPVINYIRELYTLEDTFKLFEDKKRGRATKSKQIVDELFNYLKNAMNDTSILPSSLFYKACGYAFKNEMALRVFLSMPEVPLDNNVVERENRYNAMGRKNYMFHWTEVGAKNAAILYSLVTSCVSNDINPYTYLVDVLQRIQVHPARQSDMLTPKNWKENFKEDDPFRS